LIFQKIKKSYRFLKNFPPIGINYAVITSLIHCLFSKIQGGVNRGWTPNSNLNSSVSGIQSYFNYAQLFSRYITRSPRYRETTNSSMNSTYHSSVPHEKLQDIRNNLPHHWAQLSTIDSYTSRSRFELGSSVDLTKSAPFNSSFRVGRTEINCAVNIFVVHCTLFKILGKQSNKNFNLAFTTTFIVMNTLFYLRTMFRYLTVSSSGKYWFENGEEETWTDFRTQR